MEPITVDLDMTDRDPQREARAWFEKLGQRKVTTAEVEDFAAWRHDPENDAAYSALELGLERGRRFVVRPMIERYQIVDGWTGETASLGGALQTDLGDEEARRAAAKLNGSQQDRSKN